MPRMTDDSAPPGYTIPDGYRFEGIGRCRSCRADIMWCRTRTGKRAPLDPSGVSHFATCPDAASFRRAPIQRP
jgi:hypothetical protein